MCGRRRIDLRGWAGRVGEFELEQLLEFAGLLVGRGFGVPLEDDLYRLGVGVEPFIVQSFGGDARIRDGKTERLGFAFVTASVHLDACAARGDPEQLPFERGTVAKNLDLVADLLRVGDHSQLPVTTRPGAATRISVSSVSSRNLTVPAASRPRPNASASGASSRASPSSAAANRTSASWRHPHTVT